jgi:predicted transcriptional regulator
MCQMLLSINPEHVENILLGKKRFEFRKVRCKSDVDKILIYATAPEKMVVAEAEVEDIIEGDIDTVWGLTHEYSGISYDFYTSYYEGKDKAVAYKLRKVRKFEKPKPLSEFGIRCAPQSFIYLAAAT